MYYVVVEYEVGMYLYTGRSTGVYLLHSASTERNDYSNEPPAGP